ncbi:BamA/TamA family outer membrane protein [Spirosoma sp. KNUC1025]|uniref:BamA/TamA family outer membrane protein n=1 Tax=Spirosoma sp. KNUC1025 TaxID=2894082 RepID=UPI00386A8DB5|nr:BamA/TamA family outer membrane protein [Spirosoma sp. KNUC1025]
MFPEKWPIVGWILTVFLLASQSVFASISVDSAQKVVVRSVTLKGNYRTRDRIILREMTLHVGDSVRLSELPERVAWDQRNINNTTLFITVDTETRITPSDDTTQLAQLDLTVIMKERWYLIAYPVFDLADRNLNEWWYDRGRDFSRVIYGGRLSYRNVTGNNDRLQLAIELGFLQRAVVSYSIPYIDKAQKIGLRVDVSYQTNKEIPYRTQFDKWVYAKSENVLRERAYAAAVLTHRRGLYHYHTLDVRYNRNTIADTVAQLNPDYFLDSKTTQQFMSLSYNYRYDRRDNVVYPLRGTLFSAGVGVSGLLPTDNFHFLDIGASVTRYWPLGGRFYAAGNLRARSTWPTRQPYFNLRGLGNSSDMVRGYELYVIDGQRTAIWRNSIRYQLVNTRKQLNWLHIRQFNTVPISIYLTGFADAGYVSSTVAEQYQSQLANRLLLGTGMSLDLVTFYNLVMRFSGTINAQGKTGFFFNLAQEL